MEESLFLEAENLRNKIHALENCIETYEQNNMSKICICWDEYGKKVNWTTGDYGCIPNFFISEDTIKMEQAVPTELEKDIIKFLKNKLEEYKKEFNEL